MLKSLFYLWLKDRKLWLLVGVITLLSILLGLCQDDDTIFIASALLTFVGGTGVANDDVCGTKSQQLLYVSSIGSSGYMLAKFVWVDLWTLLLFILTTAIPLISSALHGTDIGTTTLYLPFIAIMPTMLTNCVGVPCICLFRRATSTVLFMVIVFATLIVGTLILNSLMQNEALFTSIINYLTGLHNVQRFILMICGILVCSAAQLLTWVCVRKAHVR